jgi:hypothetical protein
MGKMTTLLLIMMGAAVVISGPAFAGDAPQELKNFAHAELVKLCSNQAVIEAVRMENEKNKPLAQIKNLDQEWQSTPGVDGFMKSLMNNACATYLLSLQEQYPYLVEIFVMDNKGANVAMTNKTSDYWQGDEAKFTESYANGRGAVHFGDIEFDDSAQAYLVQVSVPVREGSEAVGAVTFGIDLDAFEAAR